MLSKRLWLLLILIATLIRPNIIIDTPGEYYLTRLHNEYVLFGMIDDEMRVIYNLSAVSNSGGAILAADVSNRLTISASDVSLQLGNHCLTGGIDITGSRVLVGNGYVDGSDSVSSGIKAFAGTQDVSIRNVTVYGALTGIEFDGVNGGLIDNCDFIQNTTGLFFRSTSNIAVNESRSISNLNAGFELLSSGTCCFTHCKALSTGQNNLQTSDQIIVGFISTNGSGNVFEQCIANETRGIVTDTNSLVAGFALRGSESCTKIIAGESANTSVGLTGDAIPYGIILQEVSHNSPVRNIVMQNVIYCNVTTQTGIGIYGNDVSNVIIQNTVHNNPINLQIGSNLDLIISQIDEPTLLQNIALPANTPIPFPEDNFLTTQQIKYKLCNNLATAFDIFSSVVDTLSSDTSSGCFSTAISESTTINTSGIYCLGASISGTIGIDANDVQLNLNNHRVIQGITVNAGLDQIKIENGVVENNANSDAIKVNSGCSNIIIQSVIAKNGLRGISFENVSGGLIRNCGMTQNTTGLELNACNNIVIDECDAIRNKNAGFDLISSTTNVIQDCKALSTGEGNNNVLDQTIFGFVSSNGHGNVFERCIANSTQALSTTDQQSLVAGFALRGSESCTKIIECESANAQTDVTGVTVPYGMLLQGTTLDPITTITHQDDIVALPGAVSWSPDGKYLAAGIIDSNRIAIYEFNRNVNTFTHVAYQDDVINNPNSVVWSPDGVYIAAAITNLERITIYEFNREENTLTHVAYQDDVIDSPHTVAWSPDGVYVAASIANSNRISIYEFNRDANTLTHVADQNDTIDNPNGISWSPDGNYIAVAIFNSSRVSIYEFNREVNTLTHVADQNDTISNPISVFWSPDGNYVAVAIFISSRISIYEFNREANTLTHVADQNDTISNPISVFWSPDGKYVAAAIVVSNRVSTYQFDKGANTLEHIADQDDTILTPVAVSWSPDGTYLAAAIANSNRIVIYQVLQFPSKNIVKDNIIYCNSGGIFPSGIGISGSSIANIIIGNTAYCNPIDPPVVGTNYAFVANVFNQLFGDAPTVIQNISVDCNQVLLTPPNNSELALQLLSALDTFDTNCALIPITSDDISGGIVSITGAGHYYVTTDLTTDFAITATCVTVDLNGRCITGVINVNDSENIKLENGVVKGTSGDETVVTIDSGCLNIVLDNLSIIGIDGIGGAGQPGVSMGAQGGIISRCMIQGGDAVGNTNFGGDAIIAEFDARNILIQDCVLMSGNGGNGTTAGSGGSGIEIRSGNLQTTIRNCIVFSTGNGGNGSTTNGNGGNGITIQSGAIDAQVTNCTIRNTGVAGVGAGTAGVGGKAIDDNVAAGADESQIFGNFAHNIANAIRFDLQASGVESGVVSPNPPTSTVINPLANVYT